MDGINVPPNLTDFRPRDRRLQPGPMVEGSIPVTDRRVVLAKRHFEIVVIVESNNRSFYANAIGIRLRREADFPEVADLA